MMKLLFKTMMKLLLFITLLFCGTSILPAQENFSQQYGKMTQYEINMTSYEKDPDAEAVVIYENGKTSFVRNESEGRFDLVMTKEVKIKILNQAGIKYANFEIPYYLESSTRMEDVESIEAITYNYENGKLTKTELNSKNIFTEKINENWKMKVFAMPNVREGSIIELRYKIVSPYLFNIREWFFQHKIPVVESTFRVSIIPYYEYTYIMKGSTKFDVFNKVEGKDEIRWGELVYRELHYTFGMKNVPAFRDETFITSENDYLISLNFQLSKIHYFRGGYQSIMTTWPDLCNDFLKADYFGKYIKDAEKEGKKIIPTLGLTGKSQEEQIKIISDYVKLGYHWNGQYRKYATGKLSNFMKEKTGSSADLNLFLLGLLKAAKIEAQPILLSTRKNGAVSESHPFEKFFNYVIVRIKNGEKSQFLDVTERLLVYNELPDRCINVRGLVVEPKSGEWIDIIQDELALTEKKFEIRCQENLETLNSQITYTAFNYDAYNYRTKYNGEESNLKDLLLQRDIKSQGKIDVQNAVELDKPFVFTFQTETTLENNGEKLFIAPFLNQSVTENIFKQTTRKLPVDLIHRHAAKYHSTIYIPEGYEVNYLPASLNYDGLIILNYLAKENNGTIEITGDYEFKNSTYNAKDYMKLKSVYNEMIKKFNEMIVLSKKK